MKSAFKAKKKDLNKSKEILVELLPILVILIILIFEKRELAITLFAIIGILVTFKIKYYPKEIYFLLFGIVMGIIFELIANFLLGQAWGEASFFTIPVWLPFTWGYGFILIRRIGNIIVRSCQNA